MMRRIVVVSFSLGLISILFLLKFHGVPLGDQYASAEQQEAEAYSNLDAKLNKTDILSPEAEQTGRIQIPIKKMRDALHESRLEFDQVMKELYGESFFPVIFHKVQEAFQLNEISKTRFLRRVKIKLLRPYFNNTASFDHTFTWVTAGHSNAAAHGNLYNQSYTYTLERYARKAFQSVGIDFIAKNYAMGGYGSGPELSLCLESIYGQKFDLFSWNFGMTDGRNYFNLELILNRIVTVANTWSINSSDQDSYLPTILLVGPDRGRLEVMANAEKNGLGVIVSTPDPILDSLKEKLPDADVFDQGNLTDHLSNFICKGKFEACGNNYKFRTEPCKTVKGQVGWHDGWRKHQLYGVLFADMLIQVLQEAADELEAELSHPNELLQKNTTSLPDLDIDPFQLFSRLQEEEKNERLSFLNETFVMKAGNDMKDIPLDVLARKTSFCHTALLPSQARYDGIVTGSGNKKSYFENFDTGKNKIDILDSRDGGNISIGSYSQPQPLQLSFDAKSRPSCDALLLIDHKDFFLVPGGVGWVSAVVPNNAEIESYAPRAGVDIEGILILCLRLCEWGRCSSDFFDFTGFYKEKDSNGTNVGDYFQMEVDGISVLHTRQLGNCHFLRTEDNRLNWGPGNEKGQYEIKFKLDKKDQHLHISSLIVL